MVILHSIPASEEPENSGSSEAWRSQYVLFKVMGDTGTTMS
jgi:hypothetical protein